MKKSYKYTGYLLKLGFTGDCNCTRYKRALVGVDSAIKDTALLKQFKEVDSMPDDEKNALMKVISAYIRDFHTKAAYQ